MILHEKTKDELGNVFETASNRSIFYCICDYCGKEFTRTKRIILECNVTVAKDSCGIGACKKKKSEEVQLIKFGCLNYGATKESAEKCKKTNIEKYGTAHYNTSEACRAKNRSKYGVDYFSQTQEFKEKLKEKCLEKYGVDHYAKNSDFRKKFRQLFKEKYGVDHFSKTDLFKDKLKQTMMKKHGCDSYFKSEEYRALYRMDSTNNYGKTQKEIGEYLLELGFDFRSDNKILEGKEIDLFNDKLKLGIEYCGLFWHNELSPQPRLKDFHYKKYKKCLEEGIRLITIFEDEWRQKKLQCKSIIRSILGKYQKKIHARKCEVLPINKTAAKKFYEENHILGSPRSILFSVGLVFQDELVGAISLGRHHRKKSDTNCIILNRLCFKIDTQVIGGASKLLHPCISYCKDNEMESISTWSDNRYSSGQVYEKIGFTLDGELPPDYSYVEFRKPTRRLSKQSQKKNKAARESGSTEKEWCLHNGLARIWDCGKKRWKYTVI
jgi:G:T-mismatch repair DNA endonuclease (very short patch repair protein)